uniref:Integrin alpha-8-like n=1 Tax=Camelus bactrianus TaxID=9837 RepID=A0A9W3EIM1_CAMBA|nr:integrin alpha-8-like [Camelus bactrianus]
MICLMWYVLALRELSSLIKAARVQCLLRARHTPPPLSPSQLHVSDRSQLVEVFSLHYREKRPGDRNGKLLEERGFQSLPESLAQLTSQKDIYSFRTSVSAYFVPGTRLEVYRAYQVNKPNFCDRDILPGGRRGPKQVSDQFYEETLGLRTPPGLDLSDGLAVQHLRPAHPLLVPQNGPPFLDGLLDQDWSGVGLAGPSGGQWAVGWLAWLLRFPGLVSLVSLVAELRDDLIVGAFGTGKVAVYRARPVVTVEAQLLLHPVIINLENKTCQIPEFTASVACFSLRACASVAGQSISDSIGLTVEVQLDSLKQKGAIKRTLFLDNHQSHLAFPLVIKGQKSLQCQDFIVYLRDETEFRDKLSPINISLNYSLDESTFKEGLEVKPILNHYRENVVTEQAHILVDCGEDNTCIPDLKLSARPDKDQVIIGDENHLMLTINARNEGEGAYEAELFVVIPEEADYVGIERSNKGSRPLSCEYKMENVTRMVVCDLGNPMVAGTNSSLGLRFAVPRLEKTNMSISFDLQIRSSNKDNPDSNFVSLQINITAVAQVEIRGVSHPPQIVLPIHNWEPEEEPRKEDGVGPLVEHIYELHNIGPSTISDTLLEVGWPFSARDEFLLYIFHIQTLGPLRCQTNPDINPQDIKPAAPWEDTPELSAFLRNSTIPHLVRKRDVAVLEPHRQSPAKILNCTNIECLQISCAVGRLEGGESAVLKVRSRLWARTFLQRKNNPYSLASLVSFEVKKMPYKDQPAKLPEGSIAIKTSVIWATPNVSFSIPLWVIILAILLGLLVLAILTLALWKCGFFDRARPPQDDMNDRERLTNEKTPDA